MVTSTKMIRCSINKVLSLLSKLNRRIYANKYSYFIYSHICYSFHCYRKIGTLDHTFYSLHSRLSCYDLEGDNPIISSNICYRRHDEFSTKEEKDMISTYRRLIEGDKKMSKNTDTGSGNTFDTRLYWKLKEEHKQLKKQAIKKRD